MKKFFLASIIALVTFGASMASPVSHSCKPNNENFYQTKKKPAKTPHKKHHPKKKSTIKKK